MLKKYLLCVFPIVLGIACLTIHATNSSISHDGFLVEPFFFLVPISYLLFTIGIVSILLTTVRSRKQR